MKAINSELSKVFESFNGDEGVLASYNQFTRAFFIGVEERPPSVYISLRAIAVSYSTTCTILYMYSCPYASCIQPAPTTHLIKCIKSMYPPETDITIDF